MKNENTENKLRTAAKVLLFVYTALMLALMFGRARFAFSSSYKEMLLANMNLIPFRTVKEMCEIVFMGTRAYLLRLAVVNLVGNVIMFVPFGFLLPLGFRACERLSRTLLYMFCALLICEAAQLFSLRGIFDVDDLIFNLAGVCAGYGVFRLCKKVLAKRTRKNERKNGNE